MQSRIGIIGWLLANLCCAPAVSWQQPMDLALRASADWQLVPPDKWSATIAEWQRSTAGSGENSSTSDSEQLWQGTTTIDALRGVVTGIFPGANDVLQRLDRGEIEPHVLMDELFLPLHSQLPASALENVKAIAAVTLTRGERYDLAENLFQKIDLAQVLDPASVLFYHGLCLHHLMYKENCVETLRRLLRNADQLPRRYQVLAELMIADMERLELDSLDEVSRLMADIRRRQAQFQAGDKVREQEQSVVDKLDKLIESLEQQQQQDQQASASGGSTPMQESQRLGGHAEGIVTPQRLAEGGSWGDLPPQEREANLSAMTKELPIHFRAVVEEYFRQLAGQRRPGGSQ